MGLNESQTKQIYALAKERKVFMMEAMWSRCMPTYKKVKQLLKDGEIGTVRFAQSNFGYAIMKHERIHDPKLGGGALLDIG